MRRHLAITALLASGCATTLSSNTTARPVEPGHVEVSLATGFYAPVGAALGAVGVGQEVVTKIVTEAAAGRQYDVTDDDRQKLITAGIALAVLPPSPSQEINARTGILKDWDFGLRYSVNAARLDTKYRVFHTEDTVAEPYRFSFDVAVGAAASKYLFSNFVFDALDFVHLGDFSRYDFEFPVYVSAEWGYIWRLYAVPKYIYSHTEFDAVLSNTLAQSGNVTGLDLTVPGSVDLHFFGASAGAMVGYRYAWLVLEVTGGYTACRPFVLGRRRDLGGATFFPSIGVVVRL